MRKIKFTNNEYYHIYNRGVDKREIFCCERDFVRFLTGMREFNNGLTREQRNYAKLNESELGSEASEPSSDSFSLAALVEIICYCLNQNHYHFILKQLAQDGISRFIHKLSTSYTNYFNKKYDRSGSLFQGKYKAIHIDTNEYLLWLSGYVNGNAEVHKIAKAEDYKWCSYQDYLG
ncbi:MAG: transposase, partial [Patescibacteria group bacterium]|nr:transposase [Patescibacteria group bacterium]